VAEASDRLLALYLYRESVYKMMNQSKQESPLSLTSALKIARGKGEVNANQAGIKFYANVRIDQLKVFIDAYLVQSGIPRLLYENSFGALLLDLSKPPPDGLDGIVIMLDSDFFGIGQSLRNLLFSSRAPSTNSIDLAISAVTRFLNVAKCPVILLMQPVFFRSLDPTPNNIESNTDRLWLEVSGGVRKICADLPHVSFVPTLDFHAPIDHIWHLNTGEPLKGGSASLVASRVVDAFYASQFRHGFLSAPKKILFTDLDNTFWHGILGDDGVDNILFDDSPSGRPHMLYQKFLRNLADEGVVLAVVSKNSPDRVREAFSRLPLHCPSDRFAAINAQWSPKSESINRLLKGFNLLPESAVFIDDNEFELNEVAGALPGISCVHFSPALGQFPQLIAEIRSHFMRVDSVTGGEVRLRSYQSMIQSGGADSGEWAKGNQSAYDLYLCSLGMSLTFGNASGQNQARAFELLNKTNQFNLNGRRISRSEFESAHSSARIFTISLRDRDHDYGVVGVMVLDELNESILLKSCVLSCRVFSRGIERTIFSELAKWADARKKSCVIIQFRSTERNQPLRAVFESEIESGDFVLDSDKLLGIPFPGDILWESDDAHA